ncbi:endolytic transglycosylase MltG [Gordonia sp. NPDC003425]
MTDDRHRNRHRENSDHPTEGIDLERLRYFTQPAEGRPAAHHRRRRGADSPTGQIPAVRGDDTVRVDPQPTRRRADSRTARPAPRTPQPPPRRVRATPPDPDGDTTPTPTMRSRVNGTTTGTPTSPTTGPDADRRAVVDRPRDRPRTRATPAVVEAEPVGDHLERDHRERDRPERHAPDRGHLRRSEALDHHDVLERDADVAVHHRPRRGRGRSPQSAARRRKRRVVLAVVLTCLLVAVIGVGFVGLRAAGLLDSRKDYTNASGTADVIVDIPANSTLKDFGRILTDEDVVGSPRAFVNAADGQTISGGFYKLRTEIPAATAVQMLTDGTDHRVGRVVIPEGLQLDTKNGIDGKTTPGIFQMIADATSVTVNGTRIGVTVEDLQKAAAQDTPQQLGVPSWAADSVQKLDGDHRRIEGLIAPGTWETIDPRFDATRILHDLITKSAAQFEAWGLLNQNSSGLTPYETLTAASVVEREVTMADDYPKVARVIVNRLAKGQRLEMDSTANYTATVTNIDVYGDAYKADNVWNTYQIKGLPATPIGAVGERALEATENPSPGNWLYFVTVDRDGTTLFADNFEQHKLNRERACENKLLTTGCS